MTVLGLVGIKVFVWDAAAMSAADAHEVTTKVRDRQHGGKM